MKHIFINYLLYSLNATEIDRVATEECTSKFSSVFMAIFNVQLVFGSDQLKR